MSIPQRLAVEAILLALFVLALSAQVAGAGWRFLAGSLALMLLSAMAGALVLIVWQDETRRRESEAWRAQAARRLHPSWKPEEDR